MRFYMGSDVCRLWRSSMIPKTKFFIEKQGKDASKHISSKIPKKAFTSKIME